MKYIVKAGEFRYQAGYPGKLLKPGDVVELPKGIYSVLVKAGIEFEKKRASKKKAK